MKNFEIMPTEENLLKAIKENILKRNDALVYFYKLLLAQDNGTIIAIDGRWGSGKTFFVKQEMMIINAMNPRSKIEQEVKQEILNSVCIDVNKNEEVNANAKSVLSVLGACIKSGDEITIICEGEDEETALSDMVQLVKDGLGE